MPLRTEDESRAVALAALRAYSEIVGVLADKSCMTQPNALTAAATALGLLCHQTLEPETALRVCTEEALRGSKCLMPLLEKIGTQIATDDAPKQ